MATDPHFSEVISLLPCTGEHNSTAFTDVKGKVWTATGSAKIVTNAPEHAGFGTVAASIQSAAGRITTGPHADWALGAGDFTLEGWFYNTSGSGSPFLQDMSPTNEFHSLFLDSSTSGRVVIDNLNKITGIVVPASAWYFYALVRYGNALKAYVNGVNVGTAGVLSGSVLISDGTGDVSMFSNASHTVWRGYAKELRGTKRARYLEDFEPPTGPFFDGNLVAQAESLILPLSLPVPSYTGEQTGVAESLIIPLVWPALQAQYDQAGVASSLTIPLTLPVPQGGIDQVGSAEPLVIPLTWPVAAGSAIVVGQTETLVIPWVWPAPTGSSDVVGQTEPLVIPWTLPRLVTFYRPPQEKTTYPVMAPETGADGLDMTPGGWAPYPATPLPSASMQSLHWAVSVRLGGVDVSARLTGTVTVEAEEDSARVANFSLTVPAGTAITIRAWFGQTVTIDFIRSAGGVPQPPVRLFTGRVAQPTYDLVSRVAGFACTDDLQNYCRQNDVSGLINGLSSTMIELPTDGWDKAQALLATRNASLQLDAHGQACVTEWDPNGDIDWLFDADTILDETPTLDVPDWLSQVNQVELEFSHRYTRLWSQRGQTSWFPPLTFTQMMVGHGMDNFNRFGPDRVVPYKFLPKKTVFDVFQNSGLVLDQSVKQPPVEIVTQFPGYYVDPSALGYPGLVFSEMPSGLVTIVLPNADVSYYSSSKRSYVLCQGFWAFWSRHWAQERENVIKVTLKNPVSVQLLGAVVEQRSARYTTEFDSASWESDAAKGLPVPDLGDANVDPVALNAAFRVEVAKAQKTIFASHRRSTVGFTTSLIADVSIGQRVKVETPHIKVTGQVRSLSFEMDIESGAATTQWGCAVMALQESLYPHVSAALPDLPPLPTPSVPGVNVDFNWEYEVIEDPPFGWEDDPGYQPVYKKNEATLSVEGVPDLYRDFAQKEAVLDYPVGWIEDELEIIA